MTAIEGVETFGGECIHTSRWDYNITGGHPSGDFDGLEFT